MKPIRSETDKRLIGHIAKKSRRKKINVYFNKTASTGQTKYLSGSFYSKKNDDHYPYKSSYELAYLMKLEEDPSVVKFLYEPFSIPYIDFYKKQRAYLPDFLVLYETGKILITEIKPTAMLVDFDVKAKAKACREFIAATYTNVEYKFITEKDLFKGPTDYTNFIREMRNYGTTK